MLYFLRVCFFYHPHKTKAAPLRVSQRLPATTKARNDAVAPGASPLIEKALLNNKYKTETHYLDSTSTCTQVSSSFFSWRWPWRGWNCGRCVRRRARKSEQTVFALCSRTLRPVRDPSYCSRGIRRDILLTALQKGHDTTKNSFFPDSDEPPGHSTLFLTCNPVPPCAIQNPKLATAPYRRFLHELP